MFFLGGMTMGYLEPPVKSGRTEEQETRRGVLSAETDRRRLEPVRREGQDNVLLRSLLWSWRTVC